MSEMQSLLAKAETPDLEFLVETLSSPWNLSSTGKMREALERTEQDPTGPRKEELRTLLESELRYAGSADLAFVTKKVLKAIGLRQKEPGVAVPVLIRDVSKKLKVKQRRVGSVEAQLERLVKAVVERQFMKLPAEKQRELLRAQGVEGDRIEEIMARLKKHGKVAVLPLLLAILGQQIVEKLIVALTIQIIATFIGREAAKELITSLAARYPIWAQSLGPIVWVLSAGWVGFDLQGPAYRIAVPALLYLGLIGLRDGPEDGQEFWGNNETGSPDDSK